MGLRDTAGQVDPPVGMVDQASFSGNNGTCVEVAALPDGHIAMRNSTHRDDGTILFTHAELNTWISGVKEGEFDDLPRKCATSLGRG